VGEQIKNFNAQAQIAQKKKSKKHKRKLRKKKIGTEQAFSKI